MIKKNKKQNETKTAVDVTITNVLITIWVTVLLFTAIMIIVFIATNSVPDALCYGFYGLFSIGDIVTGLIKLRKVKSGGTDCKNDCADDCICEDSVEPDIS